MSTKRIKLNLLFKLSYQNSNFALTLVYLKPALNNPAQPSTLLACIFLESLFVYFVCIAEVRTLPDEFSTMKICVFRCYERSQWTTLTLRKSRHRALKNLNVNISVKVLAGTVNGFQNMYVQDKRRIRELGSRLLSSVHTSALWCEHQNCLNFG